jgi:gluconate 2-dehydrogenase gamma chain
MEVSVLRRQLLASTAAAALMFASRGEAREISGQMPWSPDADDPPQPVRPGGWTFFTPEEGAALEAIVDRLIPHDDLSVGAKEAGVAVFIDRQLSGPFGRRAREI